ncbi:HBL142Wp [Eremothecium sinecaudum]|uniref:HBL142Wp n=1 Tax=Eremothecium sinecaudum TaxID=45286 RepID=A0A125RDW4_9SACH|nr:HBL142Wp [Eremothecium sinecaudum]AMD18760.1 HBL142Wp [Eremothecium sinecaudum]
MNSQVTNLVIMLAMMKVSQRLNMEDPTTIFYIRVLYATCTITTYLIYAFTRRRILAKNDLTTLKYVIPANPLAGQKEPQLKVTTVRDYDLEQVDSCIKSIYTSLMMMGFMHLYMKYTNPLLMQSISPVKSALENNEVRIHLFGKPATGDFKRPFKQAGLFGMGASNQPLVDKKSIEEAEKAGTGGIKTE